MLAGAWSEDEIWRCEHCEELLLLPGPGGAEDVDSYGDRAKCPNNSGRKSLVRQEPHFIFWDINMSCP